jgi:phosphatidate cytidylyltransferase
VLLTRIKTALVLLPLVLGALFLAPVWGWSAFCALLMGLAAWEWSRLAGLDARMQKAFTAGALGAMLAIALLTTSAAMAMLAKGSALVAVVFWGVAAPSWLARRARGTPCLNAAAGAAVLLPMFVALIVLREVSPWLLLSFALIVWVADIAAYFAGKSLGRHKLAPAISPGKTLEGALGGLLGVTVFFFVWRALAHSQAGGAPAAWAAPLLGAGWGLLLVFLALGVASILGDLFESWLKRGANMKDSSRLLPGHGGVLDRIDALTSTLPLAMAWWLFGTEAAS